MMKPVNDQPPLPQPPREQTSISIWRWTSDLTKQLVTYLRTITYRLNRTFTDDNIGLKTINDADLTEAEADVLVDLAQGTTPSGGDVVGPAGVTSGNVAVFDGATGKLLKSGGTLGSAAFTASTAYLSSNGGTLHGSLNLSSASATIKIDSTSSAYLDLDKGASGDYSYLTGRTAGVTRWFFYLGDGTAETGSNAGSDFGWYRVADDGTALGRNLTVWRATGGWTLEGATGGDPGTGKINAQGFEEDGTPIHEEGTWTPTFIGVAGTPSDPTVTYSSQRGSWARNGKHVHIDWEIIHTAYLGGSGTYVGIGGLPDFGTYETYQGVGACLITFPTVPANFAGALARIGAAFGSVESPALAYVTTTGGFANVNHASLAHTTGSYYCFGSLDITLV
jgi:hypothetical protein